MIVSTKGRYALRVMVHFAQRGGEEYIPLKEIAEAEGISQKYLESIMTTLSKAGFVGEIFHDVPVRPDEVIDSDPMGEARQWLNDEYGCG